MDAGYAITAYVSNMSSGYSGNLGFKMPGGWSYDQFDEITIDDWGIDKIVVSSSATPVSNLAASENSEFQNKEPNDSFERSNYTLPLVDTNIQTVSVHAVINMVIEIEKYCKTLKAPVQITQIF